MYDYLSQLPAILSMPLRVMLRDSEQSHVHILPCSSSFSLHTAIQVTYREHSSSLHPTPIGDTYIPSSKLPTLLPGTCVCSDALLLLIAGQPRHVLLCKPSTCEGHLIAVSCCGDLLQCAIYVAQKRIPHRPCNSKGLLL